MPSWNVIPRNYNSSKLASIKSRHTNNFLHLKHIKPLLKSFVASPHNLVWRLCETFLKMWPIRHAGVKYESKNHETKSLNPLEPLLNVSAGNSQDLAYTRKRFPQNATCALAKQLCGTSKKSKSHPNTWATWATSEVFCKKIPWYGMKLPTKRNMQCFNAILANFTTCDEE